MDCNGEGMGRKGKATLKRAGDLQADNRFIMESEVALPWHRRKTLYTHQQVRASPVGDIEEPQSSLPPDKICGFSGISGIRQ